jgi:hypothetical protein
MVQVSSIYMVLGGEEGEVEVRNREGGRDFTETEKKDC